MNEDILEQLWSNLHDNIELVDLQFDSQDIVLEDVAIESVRLELEINKQIQHTIIKHIKHRQQTDWHNKVDGVVDLSGLHYDNPAALLKYLSHCDDTVKVNLSGSDIKKEVL